MRPHDAREVQNELTRICKSHPQITPEARFFRGMTRDSTAIRQSSVRDHLFEGYFKRMMGSLYPINPMIGVVTTQRQMSFMFECFGEVARITSHLDEPDDQFTTAMEVRRF